MDLRQVRYFLAVAQHLHFCRAARRLKISQPTLSQQIRALERRVGAELFIRDPKGLVLSPAGNAFIHKARLAVREAEAAIQDALDAKNGVTGHLKILCSPLAEYTLLKDVLRLMRQSCPALTVEVHFASGAAHPNSIADDAFSAYFMTCHSSLSEPALLCETLYYEDCVVMLPDTHPLAKTRTLSLRQLAQETWIVTDLSESLMKDELLLSACQEAGFEPKLLRPTEWHSLFPLVASGAGISLVPEALQSIRRPELRFVPLADGLQIPVNIICRKDDASPHLLQFRQQVAQAVAVRSAAAAAKVHAVPAARRIPSRRRAAPIRIARREGARIPSSVIQVPRHIVKKSRESRFVG